MTQTALVTGIAGQDGSYLAELLLEQGVCVVGIIRRNSVPEHQDTRIDHIIDDIQTIYGDVTDPGSLTRAFREVRPDFVFNLAAQSHVRISFDIPQYTAEVNALGVLNVLEAMRRHSPKARLYQASSSEMFGTSVDDDGYQRLTTPMNPTSPYGCAKVFGYNTVRHYRRAHGLFAVNGILFNHESPRRGSNFVTAKVVKTAVEIKRGLAVELRMGNLESQRDWGHSKDYVRAMWLMLQEDEPDDYIVATGETRSVRELCEYIFDRLGMDYRNHVVQDARYMRPEELPYLRGDASKAQEVLGWWPTYTFEGMMDELIKHWETVIGAK